MIARIQTQDCVWKARIMKTGARTEAVRLELNQAVASWTWDDSSLKVDDPMKDEEFVEAIRPSETERNEEELGGAAADVEMNIGNDRRLKEFDSADEKLGNFKPSSDNTKTTSHWLPTRNGGRW